MKNYLFVVAIIFISAIFMSCEDPNSGLNGDGVVDIPTETYVIPQDAPAITSAQVHAFAGKVALANGTELIGEGFTNPAPIAVSFDVSDNTPQKQEDAVKKSFEEAFKVELPKGIDNISVKDFEVVNTSSATLSVSIKRESGAQFWDSNYLYKEISIPLTGTFIQIFTPSDLPSDVKTTKDYTSTHSSPQITFKNDSTLISKNSVIEGGIINVIVNGQIASLDNLKKDLAAFLNSAFTDANLTQFKIDTLTESNITYKTSSVRVGEEYASSTEVTIMLHTKDNYAFDKEGSTTIDFSLNFYNYGSPSRVFPVAK